MTTHKLSALARVSFVWLFLPSSIVLAAVLPVPSRVALPPLVLPRGAVRSATVHQRTAAEPPAEVQHMLQLLAEERQHSTAAQAELLDTAQARRRRITMAKYEVRQKLGAHGIAVAREACAETVLRELDTAKPAGDIDTRHDFQAALERYDVASGTALRTPAFIVRMLAKAQCNSSMDEHLTEGFSPVEERAYLGWIAQHAGTAPLTRRLEAAERLVALAPHDTNARLTYELLLMRAHRAELAWRFLGDRRESDLRIRRLQRGLTEVLSSSN